MKTDFLSSLPTPIANCYRVFVVHKSHHWKAAQAEDRELWVEMHETVLYVDGHLEYKKMLPLFFEQSWREVERGEYLDLWPLRVLVSHKWREWPEEEQKNVGECFSFLSQTAADQNKKSPWSEILSTAQWIGLPCVPLLEIWFASSVPASALEWFVSCKEWNDLPPDVRSWLCQPRVLARVEADFFAATDSKDAKDISNFFETLKFWCAC